MSLDVYLYLDAPPIAPAEGSGIYVRRNGQVVEITRAEWDSKFPGQEPVVLAAEYGADCTVYTANITHNLAPMAVAAGCYEAMWRPEEIKATRAKDIVRYLKQGLELLRSDPERFKAYSPKNKWGSYDALVLFTASYLDACERYPEATIRVST
jgi:hypothetical protein